LEVSLSMIILAQGPFNIVFSITMGVFGIVVAAYNKDRGFILIPTDLIESPLNSIKCRIPDLPDVVNFDLEPSSLDQIYMPKISKGKPPYECLLPDQRIVNPRCELAPTEIVDVSRNVDLNYEDVVNMNDVTELENIHFSDRYELSSG